jgi:hypothetical protein
MRRDQTARTAPIGVNVDGVADWSRLPLFVDLMKSSRNWGSAKTPWVHDVPVDAAGWPLQDAGVVVRVLQQDPGEPTGSRRYLKPGIYPLSFTGKAMVRPVASSSVTLRNYAYDPHANHSTAEIVVGASATQLMLAFEGTQGGVRNVKLLAPGYGPGVTFTDEFRRAVMPFDTLRMMDVLATNANPLTSWSERTTPNSATQSGSRGVAFEYVVQMANETGKNIWINVPVGADDAYIRSLAELLRDSLDPARSVYVEFSNELWNNAFIQTHQNIAAAVSEAVAGDLTLTGGVRCTQDAFHAGKDCNSYWAGLFRAGKRLARISDIFAGVIGRRAMNQRVRPVLATQFANRHIAEQVLKNIAMYRGKPSSILYGIASAPYFYLDEALSTSPKLTADEIFASLEASLDKELLPVFAGGVTEKSGFRRDVRYQGADWSAPSQKALAEHYGLQSLAYEGGPDFRQNTVSLPAKFQANLDQRMGQLLQRMLRQWYGCGNGLFVYFSLASAYGQHGYWGLTNDPANLDAVKYRTVASFATQPLSRFHNCD